MNVVIALGLIALGMCIDAYYHSRIRIAECDAYDVGYQQGLKENTIHKEITVPDVPNLPSMAAPVEMPPTFEERLKKHGRAVVKLK
jgi:hypothetical protein